MGVVFLMKISRIISYIFAIFNPFNFFRKEEEPFSSPAKVISAFLSLTVSLLIDSWLLVIVLSPIIFPNVYSDENIKVYYFSELGEEDIGLIIDRSKELVDSSPIHSEKTNIEYL